VFVVFVAAADSEEGDGDSDDVDDFAAAIAAPVSYRLEI
jgi:hypothetical protein